MTLTNDLYSFSGSSELVLEQPKTNGVVGNRIGWERHMKGANMVGWVFSRITLKLQDIWRKFYKNYSPFGIVEKGIIDNMVKIQET